VPGQKLLQSILSNTQLLISVTRTANSNIFYIDPLTQHVLATQFEIQKEIKEIYKIGNKIKSINTVWLIQGKFGA